jgi:hypothetical protein
MSESQTASTEVTIESPGFVRQTEGLLCHNSRTLGAPDTRLLL